MGEEADAATGAASKSGIPQSRSRSDASAQLLAHSTREKPRDELKVWLGNLPWSADEAALGAHFGKFGEIARIHLPLNESGGRIGSGYVHYKSKDAVEKVLL